MKSNEVSEAFDGIRDELRNAAILRLREGLWKMAFSFLCDRDGIDPTFVVDSVERAIREQWAELEAVPDAPATMQDALAEFRSEAIRLSS